jgi:aminoglycoside phosphotransferase family enzyme/predicted kinase
VLPASDPPLPGEITLADQARMVAALVTREHEARGAEDAGAVEVVQTHISFVLLAGGHACKIRKALNLGFLDFATLAARRFDCEEELRLNRRLAPALYLGMVPITGSIDQPEFGGGGPVLDWAVRMRAFPQDAQWDHAIAQGRLEPRHVDELADVLWPFHRDAPRSTAAVSSLRGTGPGRPADVRAPVLECLDTLQTLLGTEADRARVAELMRWEVQAFGALRGAFVRRAREGFVREVHGDLHLGNVTQLDGRCTVFDCIEFNPALRWIDVMSDVAFMAMDLHSHARPGLAHRFVNAYLERSGDYAGVRVLRYYLVYRALVRAKVAALRAAQLGDGDAAVAPADSERARALAAVSRYLAVALSFSHAVRLTLMLTHGFSGSGKTTATQGLLERCGAIRVRADVERKRIFGLAANARSDAKVNARLYSTGATGATQQRLREAARVALRSGFSVILDATFLDSAPRALAKGLADALGVGFVVIDFPVDAPTLRERVQLRTSGGDDASDADLAVLESQLVHAQPLSPGEQTLVFTYQGDWAPLVDNRTGSNS